MGVKEVYFSDLTGAPAEQEQLLDMQVRHPDVEGTRVLEVLPEEVAKLGEMAIQPVVVDLTTPEGEVQRYYVPANQFVKLFVGKKVAEVVEVIDDAPLHYTPALARVERAERVRKDYTRIEYAGDPHKGKISPEEAAIVRANLEQVNARLAAAGKRLIDPENEEHRKRYGFDQAERFAQQQVELAIVTDKPADEGGESTGEEAPVAEPEAAAGN